MARSRPFTIHKGAGGLEGTARAIDRQGSGENNERVREFLERAPVQGSARVRVIPKDIIGPITTGEFKEGETSLDVDTVAFATGAVTGPVPGAAELGNPSEMGGEGSVVGTIPGVTGFANASVFFGEGTVV